jgi:hypothetical protein
VSAPDTYDPLPFTDEALRGLELPFVSVTEPGVPGAGADDAPPCITRGERGWQMVRGDEGPLYEFATEWEVAEFVGSRMIRPRG